MKKAFSLILGFTIAVSSIAQAQQLNLKDIFANGTYGSKYVYGLKSMNDGKHYTRVNYGDNGQSIEKYAYRNGKKVKDILKAGDFPHSFGAYQFSADENQLLLATETESIYRHSSKSVYFVFNLKTKKFEQLSKGKQMFATFSPSGDKVAFVRDNNLFVKDLSKGTETQITNDGEKNVIINGWADWVHEEEFAFDKAFFWSPSGDKIAFYKFNEAEVKEFSMDMFKGDLYPSQYRFKYPKAGEDNALVSVWVYHLESNKTQEIPSAKAAQEDYIPRVKWTKNNNLLTYQKLNRHQNQLDFILFNTEDGSEKTLLTETDEAYVDITDDLTFLDNGKEFIWSSERTGFNHLYLYNLNGELVQQLTQGDFDVAAYYGLNQNTGYVYYSSSEVSPMQRHVYRVKIDGTGKEKLSKKDGWNSANFSNGMMYFINTQATIASPAVYTLHDANGALIRTIEDNAKLSEKLKNLNIAEPEFITVPTTDNVQLNAYIIKPSNFDENKKYPVFMYVYGGPGSQTVTDNWGGSRYLWFQYLAQQGYIVVSVDNRGTGARGREFKKLTYQQLGKYEIEDQINAAMHLSGLPYVDANRIGIFGWSYGGYMSSLAITKGADVFKAAIAVAPVTTWRYYDSIYTERYMRTPQENANGYDDNSPINHVEKMKGAYLLVHGSADDNVHYQNTMEMIRAMVKADKQFDLFIYPDKNHGIYGGNTRHHLYTKMTNFLKENL